MTVFLDDGTCRTLNPQVRVFIDSIELGKTLAISNNPATAWVDTQISPGSHVIRAEARQFSWPTTAFTVPATSRYTYTLYCR